MKIAVAAPLLAISLAVVAAPAYASTDVAPASIGYRVDDPDPAPPAPVPAGCDSIDPACQPDQPPPPPPQGWHWAPHWHPVL